MKQHEITLASGRKVQNIRGLRPNSEASGAMAKIPEFERKIPKNPGIKNFAYMSTFFLASEKYKHYISAFIDKNTKKIN